MRFKWLSKGSGKLNDSKKWERYEPQREPQDEVEKLWHRSNEPDWRTPPEIFEPLNWEFGFRLDAAASAENALCPLYITKEMDAFKVPWAPGPVFCNPPSKRGESRLIDWIKRGQEQAQNQMVTVVMLVRSATGSLAWQRIVFPYASEIRFIEGRINYLLPNGQRSDPAGFDSAVVIFKPGPPRERINTWSPPPTAMIEEMVRNRERIQAAQAKQDESEEDELARAVPMRVGSEEAQAKESAGADPG